MGCGELETYRLPITPKNSKRQRSSVGVGTHGDMGGINNELTGSRKKLRLVIASNIRVVLTRSTKERFFPMQFLLEKSSHAVRAEEI